MDRNTTRLIKIRNNQNPVVSKLLASKKISDIKFVKSLLNKNISSITSPKKIIHLLGNRAKNVTHVTKLSETVRQLYSNFNAEFESLKVEAINNSIQVAEIINSQNNDGWF